MSRHAIKHRRRGRPVPARRLNVLRAWSARVEAALDTLDAVSVPVPPVLSSGRQRIEQRRWERQELRFLECQDIGRVCRECGCHQDDACHDDRGPCGWVLTEAGEESDLCTHCFEDLQSDAKEPS